MGLRTKQTSEDGRHSARAPSPLTQTMRLLRHHNLRVRKRLGQHFLVDGDVLEHIITSAELTPTDLVIEIGPGLGVLTEQLAQQAGWVIAMELDNTLAAILKQRMAPYRNVTIINEDVLKIDPAALLETQKAKFPPEINSTGYKVVANLPYYITAPTLRYYLESSAKPEMMVVMVQKEVAEEIMAKPGRLSLLSISIQLYGEPTLITRVPAHSFYPAPKVDSAILKIIVYPQPSVNIADNENFFRVIRAGFSSARKQIGNSLAQGLGLPKVETLSLLAKAGIDAQRRAQTLTLKEWERLGQTFSTYRVEAS